MDEGSSTSSAFPKTPRSRKAHRAESLVDDSDQHPSKTPRHRSASISRRSSDVGIDDLVSTPSGRIRVMDACPEEHDDVETGPFLPPPPLVPPHLVPPHLVPPHRESEGMRWLTRPLQIAIGIVFVIAVAGVVYPRPLQTISELALPSRAGTEGAEVAAAVAAEVELARAPAPKDLQKQAPKRDERKRVQPAVIMVDEDVTFGETHKKLSAGVGAAAPKAEFNAKPKFSDESAAFSSGPCESNPGCSVTGIQVVAQYATAVDAYVLVSSCDDGIDPGTFTMWYEQATSESCSKFLPDRICESDVTDVSAPISCPDLLPSTWYRIVVQGPGCNSATMMVPTTGDCVIDSPSLNCGKSVVSFDCTSGSLTIVEVRRPYITAAGKTRYNSLATYYNATSPYEVPLTLQAGDKIVLTGAEADTFVPLSTSVVCPPKINPTSSPRPSPLPSDTPTDSPSALAADTPTASPTDTPTASATNTPTATPTKTPTASAADVPTAPAAVLVVTKTPSASPTASPTNTPTMTPTNTATATPTPTSTRTTTPTSSPTTSPTSTPTTSPTSSPTASPTSTAVPVQITPRLPPPGTAQNPTPTSTAAPTGKVTFPSAGGCAVRMERLGKGHVQVSPVTFGPSVTFEAWVKFNEKPGSFARVFDFGNGAGSDNFYFGVVGTSGLGMNVYNGGSAMSLVSVYSPPVNGTWVHLAVTSRPDGLMTNSIATANTTLYVNGTAFKSLRTYALKSLQRTSNFLGRSNWAADDYPDAHMLEFRVWNSSRTADQIKASYQSTISDCSSAPDLVMRLGLNREVDGNITDSCAPSSNTSRLYNAASWDCPVGCSLVNVAALPWGNATQSSLYTDADASRAIDDNCFGGFFSKSVSHTTSMAKPWWQVTFASTNVRQVVIFPRMDCCQDRLADFDVIFYNANTTTYSYYQKTAPYGGLTIFVPGAGVQADRVRIQLRGTNYLHMAEVRVLACPSTCATSVPPKTPLLLDSMYFSALQSTCGAVSLSPMPTDRCPAGTRPVYDTILTRSNGDFYFSRVSTQGVPSCAFKDVTLASYAIQGIVSCIDPCGVVVAQGNVTVPANYVIRPLVCCTGSCGTGLWGDPHFKTLDGANVDYFLPGDYILAEAGSDFVVQDRMCIRHWGPAVSCGVAMKCGGRVLSLYTTSNSSTIVADIDGTDIPFVAGTTKSNYTAITVQYGGTGLSANQFSLQCLAGTGTGVTVTGAFNNVAGSEYYMDISMTVPARLGGVLRGLIAGSFDNNTFNDVQWRNGTVYAMADGLDPSTGSVSPWYDTSGRVNSVQQSWAVYPGVDSLFRQTLSRDAPSLSYWSRPTTRRHLLEVTTIDKQQPTDAQFAAARAACSPFLPTDGVLLESLALDFALLNGAVGCDVLAQRVLQLDHLADAPQIGTDVSNTDDPATQRRNLRATKKKITKPRREIIPACGAGSERIVVNGAFPDPIVSVSIGGYTAKIVSQSKRKLVVETQNFLAATGKVHLIITTAKGKRATLYRGVELKSSYISKLDKTTAKAGDSLKITGDFGKSGVSEVLIGGEKCKIKSQSQSQVLVQIPPKITKGKKNVILKTKRCYGDAFLPLSITIT